MMPDDLPDESDQLADNLARLRRFTPARIALRTGSGQLTATSLQFMRDHARARRRSRCT
jgi:ethanolamine ammonia-lyase small subunit